MTLPFALPDWLPAWAFLLAALPVLLYVLAFLVMPFSVLGLKSRLDAIEAQLDSLQDEIRFLASKAAQNTARPLDDDDDSAEFPHFGRLKAARQAQMAPQAPPQPPPRGRRTEPRL